MKRTAFSPHDEIFVNYINTTEKHNMPVQHYHDGYEIYLQLSGKRYLFYNNICYTLERGDIVIFKPFDLHYTESRESNYYERYVLNFQEEDIAFILNDTETAYLFENFDSGVMRLDDEQIDELLGYFKHIDKLASESGLIAKKLFHASIVELVFRVTNLLDGEQVKYGEKISPNVSKAIRYINKHYREELTLDMVCENVNISKYHFCHMFKNVTGATIKEYINNVRLIKVHSMLVNTDNKLEEIAKETGFGTALNLNRAFKKAYGIPPREFRKNKKNTTQ